MDPEAVARAVAAGVHDAVAPLLGRAEARQRAGTAHGGDPTYRIDVVGERVVEDMLGDLDDVAYFTEDEGLVVRGRPGTLLLIDPIDGTRPATRGYETCCSTVAVAPFRPGVTLGDVTYGCIIELATGALFEARRGEGASADGREVAPSDVTDPAEIFWAGGFRGQPAVALATALEEVFDVPGSHGAFFDQGSAAYSLTRLVTGQVDAYVDVGQALVERVPGMEEIFRRVGGGHVLNTTTYDTAAAYLVLRELDLPVTDALGRPVDDAPLFDGDGRSTLVSTVAACTPRLHGALLDRVREGIERLADAPA